MRRRVSRPVVSQATADGHKMGEDVETDPQDV